MHHCLWANDSHFTRTSQTNKLLHCNTVSLRKRTSFWDTDIFSTWFSLYRTAQHHLKAVASIRSSTSTDLNTWSNYRWWNGNYDTTWRKEKTLFSGDSLKYPRVFHPNQKIHSSSCWCHFYWVAMIEPVLNQSSSPQSAGWRDCFNIFIYI